MFRTGQVNFSRGEIGPQLYSRFDVDSYAAGLKRARNVTIMKFGGVTKRLGTELIGEVLAPDGLVRLLPFQFSLTQAYALEMGQGYMTPCALGGRLLEEELAITGITIASAARITAAYHGFSVGNRVWLKGIAGALGDLLNNRFWNVTSIVDANNFVVDANTTGLSAFTAATGGITRTGAPAPDPTPPAVPDPVEPETPPDTSDIPWVYDNGIPI